MQTPRFTRHVSGVWKRAKYDAAGRGVVHSGMAMSDRLLAGCRKSPPAALWLRDSTLKRALQELDILVGLSVHQDPFWANGHTKCGLYLHASSLVVSC